MKKLMQYLKLAWQEAPGYLLMQVLKTLFTNARLFANILLPKFLIEELMGGRDPESLFLWGSLIVGSNIFFTFMDNTVKKYLQTNERIVFHKMNEVMARKIMRLEYSYLENPYYLDLKDRAAFAVTNQGATVRLIESVSDVLSETLTLIGLLAIMATLGWVLILVLAIALGIMLLLYRGMSSYQVEITKKLIPINRRFSYYMGLAYDRELAKDIRLYDMQDMLKERMESYTNQTCTLFEVLGKKAGQGLGGMNAVNDAVAAFCYLYVGLRTLGLGLFGKTIGTRISIGSLTMYVSSAIRFSASMRTMGMRVVDMLQVLSYLEPYLEFMMLPEEAGEGGHIPFTEPVESIVFQDVTFTYPGAEKPVLCGVSFAVRKGEKISLVGLNGAGKSTLVKLLCRMYKADSGEILINGRNIYDYDHDSYMQAIAAVFQDYRLFHYSICENISCREKETDRERVGRLLDQVGLTEKIAELPYGIDSRFGKEYDKEGIEMSGGEGQKVAIARALYKGGSLVILDEPASALDPMAEAEIYEKFNSLVEERTALYISHRMSSSVFCDRVLVLEDGRVADFDTHENLMKKTDSLYYKLFCTQAEHYKLA